MDHSIIGSILAGGTSLLVFAYGYGRVTARIDALQSNASNYATKDEWHSLERRIDELSADIKSLRAEIMSILRSKATGGIQ